jgi:hypothetical protein
MRHLPLLCILTYSLKFSYDFSPSKPKRSKRLSYIWPWSIMSRSTDAFKSRHSKHSCLQQYKQIIMPKSRYHHSFFSLIPRVSFSLQVSTLRVLLFILPFVFPHSSHPSCFIRPKPLKHPSKTPFSYLFPTVQIRRNDECRTDENRLILKCRT